MSRKYRRYFNFEKPDLLLTIYWLIMAVVCLMITGQVPTLCDKSEY